MSRVYFTDRDLGKQFPRILAEADIAVERHADRFAPDGTDEEWLEYCGANGRMCRTMPSMLFGSKSPSRPAPSTPVDRDFAEAVRRSDTGQLSVSIGDLSKTQCFKRDLDVLRRIRERSETPTSAR